MSIRGNTIGFPLPDPRKGMDMDENPIFNLANPLNPGDVVPKKYVDDAINQVKEYVKESVGKVTPPIGFIYTSNVSTSPAEIYGGTWEKIKDRFLLASGDSFSAGVTGGEATHKLTSSEMPSHTHDIPNKYLNGGYYGSESWMLTGNGGLRFTYNHTITSNATGGNEAHNNMPPYLAVYMWKRVA